MFTYCIFVIAMISMEQLWCASNSWTVLLSHLFLTKRMKFREWMVKVKKYFSIQLKSEHQMAFDMLFLCLNSML